MSGGAMDKFFDWADAQGLTMRELARRLGYTERHLYRIKNGETQDTRNFQAHVIVEFGDDVRSFFGHRVTANDT